MSPFELYSKHEDILSHYMNGDAWPLDPKRYKNIKSILKDCKFLHINDQGRLVLKSPVPVEIQLEYWKTEYKRLDLQYQALYLELKKLVEIY